MNTATIIALASLKVATPFGLIPTLIGVLALAAIYLHRRRQL